jgi:uncharacterized membrane protein YbhN (UPF0104 family)
MNYIQCNADSIIRELNIMACMECDTSAIMLNHVTPYVSLFILAVSVVLYFKALKSDIKPEGTGSFIRYFILIVIFVLIALTIYLFCENVEIFSPSYYDGM